MGSSQPSKKQGLPPTHRRYTHEQKEQAVRLVRKIRAETGQKQGAVQRVADQLGYGVESVRSWVHQADIDDGTAPGMSSEDAERMKRLEQENRELRRANEMAHSTGQRSDSSELVRPSHWRKRGSVITVICRWSRSNWRSGCGREVGASPPSAARSGARGRWSDSWSAPAGTSTPRPSRGTPSRVRSRSTSESRSCLASAVVSR